jgi:hypothetical protein
MLGSDDAARLGSCETVRAAGVLVLALLFGGQCGLIGVGGHPLALGDRRFYHTTTDLLRRELRRGQGREPDSLSDPTSGPGVRHWYRPTAVSDAPSGLGYTPLTAPEETAGPTVADS